jgi:hypothetical protein
LDESVMIRLRCGAQQIRKCLQLHGTLLLYHQVIVISNQYLFFKWLVNIVAIRL